MENLALNDIREWKKQMQASIVSMNDAVKQMREIDIPELEAKVEETEQKIVEASAIIKIIEDAQKTPAVKPKAKRKAASK